MRTRRALLLAAGLALTGMLAGGCGGGGQTEGETLTVFAAASLADVLGEVGKAFAGEPNGGPIRVNAASSAALAVQINEGAPVDVFAAADLASLRVVQNAGNAGPGEVFARNRMVVVTPAGSTRVERFADLAKPGLRVVLAQADVPAGVYAREVLATASADGDGPGADFAARVLANVRSEEANVRAVLTKVQMGEADAGIVYVTDAAAGGSVVRAVAVPDEYNVRAEYAIAVVTATANRGLAEAFVAFLLSERGQAILARAGFEPR